MADTKNLNTEVKRLMNKFILECAKQNIFVGITQGYRTIEYQNKLYEQGRTTKGNIVTNCKGGWSPHNYGLAFDFVIMENGKACWDSRNKKWSIAGQIGEKIGLEWGGRWKKFPDMPHFQNMFGLTISDLVKGKKPKQK